MGYGNTFRRLMLAIVATSVNDDKRGVIFFVYDNNYARRLFEQTLKILDGYGVMGEIKYRDLTITFPNGKTLQFRSMLEPSERLIGIDWKAYDEFSDHYIPTDKKYSEFLNERIKRRGKYGSSE